jgi:hypothetical protein
VGVVLSAGSLNNNPTPPPSTGNLLPSQIATKGSLILSAGGSVDVSGNDNQLTSNGNDLKITATTSTVKFGTANQIVANGGNILVFAKGSITGSTNNFFHARSVGDPTSPSTSAASTGGGIEIGSGLTSSTNLTAALALKQPIAVPNPPAGALGPGVVYIGNNLGVIKANFPSTGPSPINLNSQNTIPATLTLTRGAIIFDAQGGTQNQFDGGMFQTEALKPIAMVSPLEPEEANNSTLPVILRSTESGATAVAVGNYNAELHIIEMPDGSSTIAAANQESLQSKVTGKHFAQIYARPNTHFVHTNGSVRLNRGEVFVNAAANSVELKTELATVQALKGALLSVRTIQGNTYIRSCSSAGTVQVNVDGKTFAINPGEEMLLTNHRPDESEVRPTDGIGRRQSTTTVVGSHYVTISDFAIITMLSGSDALAELVHSKDANAKRLLGQLLKTAASVSTVTSYRGAYNAR